MRRLMAGWVLALTVLAAWGQATSVVFTGQSLMPYYGQTVCFNQTLHVIDRASYSSGDYLYLSYERIRMPEDVAAPGTSLYDSLVASNANACITARCTNFDISTVRLGATITHLTAVVTGDHSIRIDGPLTLAHNERPTTRPDVGDARLVVCGANLEYYCPIWEDTYGAASDEEFALQHLKTVKALLNIDADIYALAELQQGATALDTLVAALNAATAPGRYAHVDDCDSVDNTYIKVGFLYRTDKVRPVLHLGHPTMPSANISVTQYGDYRRMELQCFEEIATGERFVLSMNHFKSKSGGDSTNNYYNAQRVEEAENLIAFLHTELSNDYYGDEDILILGDLNCGTMEEPIAVLEDAGFENQLMRFSPEGYSYSFSRQVEYLDHALASESMAAQVTGAAPYHVNADESYLLHYNYSDDTTLFRYSDHDPIIIGLNLNSTTEGGCRSLRYEESFLTSFGCFEPVNQLGGSTWYGYPSYECAAISGYSTGANVDWLVSPTFDLSGKRDATLSFTHTIGYATPATWPQTCKVVASSDFDGDVNAATWMQLPISHFPSYNWEWQQNDIILPADMQGAPAVTLAFLYEVGENDIPMWEIKDVSFRAVCEEDDDGVGEMERPMTQVWGGDGVVRISNTEPIDVEVYDLAGRCVGCCTSVTEASVPVSCAGIYLVRCGSEMHKIFVCRK
ncbi:MAG: choice-of-anchor J domain-containing protein [Bacteroidales bacterium]|nr:choice-of-anchor J domain-containing protein [Bacteroidales bacterium]